MIMDRHKNQFFLLTSFCTLFILGLADNIRGPLLPEILSHFKINHAQGALFFTLASLATLVSALLSRFLLPLWGGLRTLWVALMFLSLSQWGYFFSNTYTTFVSYSIFLGIGFGAMAVSQNFLVVQAAPAEKLGQWQSGLHSMYGLASLTSPLTILLSHWLYPSWKVAFLFVGGLSAVVATLLLIISYKYKLHHPVLRVPQDDPPDTSSFHESSYESSKSLKPKGIEFDPTMGSQMYFSMIVALYVFLEIIVGSRLATLVRSQSGWGLESGSWVTSLFFLNLFLARLLFIFKKFSFSHKTIMRYCLFGALFWIVLGVWFHPFLIIFSGLFMGPFYPLAITESGKIFSNKIGSVISNIVTFSGVITMMMHFFVGIITDQWGIRVALSFSVPIGLIALWLMASFNRRFKCEWH